MRWHVKTHKKWMIQWGWPIFFSLGIHIAHRDIPHKDFRLKYVDIHLFFIIITYVATPQEYEAYQAWWSSRNK